MRSSCFIDSDEEVANKKVADAQAEGGIVIQWPGEVCTEVAICAHLGAEGLNAFIQEALNVADDLDEAPTSYASQLVARGAPPENLATGIDTLDVTTWGTAGVNLADAKRVVAQIAKEKRWFKRVDRGRRLGSLILGRPELQVGDVATVITQLRNATYMRSEAVNSEPTEGTPQDQAPEDVAANRASEAGPSGDLFSG